MEYQNDALYSCLPKDLLRDWNIDENSYPKETKDKESEEKEPELDDEGLYFTQDALSVHLEFKKYSPPIKFINKSFDVTYPPLPVPWNLNGIQSKKYKNQGWNPSFKPRNILDPYFSNQIISFSDFINKYYLSLPSIIMSCSGSRFLQNMIPFIKPDEIWLLLQSIRSEIPEIMCNGYGNYFMQKILKISNLNDRLYTLTSVAPFLTRILMNSFGVHCIETIIDKINTFEEEKLIKNVIEPHLLELSMNSVATNIIQLLLTKQNGGYIRHFVFRNFIQLSLNLNGASICNKLINIIKDDFTITNLVHLIEFNFMQMCQDQYSNYVVQSALGTFPYTFTQNLVNKIIDNIITLATDKYASNVVDKVIPWWIENNTLQYQQVIKTCLFHPATFEKMNSSKYSQFVIMNIFKTWPKIYQAQVKSNIITKTGYTPRNSKI